MPLIVTVSCTAGTLSFHFEDGCTAYFALAVKTARYASCELVFARAIAAVCTHCVRTGIIAMLERVIKRVPVRQEICTFWKL